MNFYLVRLWVANVLGVSSDSVRKWGVGQESAGHRAQPQSVIRWRHTGWIWRPPVRATSSAAVSLFRLPAVVQQSTIMPILISLTQTDFGGKSVQQRLSLNNHNNLFVRCAFVINYYRYKFILLLFD